MNLILGCDLQSNHLPLCFFLQLWEPLLQNECTDGVEPLPEKGPLLPQPHTAHLSCVLVLCTPRTWVAEELTMCSSWGKEYALLGWSLALVLFEGKSHNEKKPATSVSQMAPFSGRKVRSMLCIRGIEDTG